MTRETRDTDGDGGVLVTLAVIAMVIVVSWLAVIGLRTVLS